MLTHTHTHHQKVNKICRTHFLIDLKDWDLTHPIEIHMDCSMYFLGTIRTLTANAIHAMFGIGNGYKKEKAPFNQIL